MSLTINTNLPSLNAQRNVATSQGALSTSLQRLSSGLRVNSARDDAAGLAIAERFNSQLRGSNVAIRNANDAVSLSQTAEGALGKVTDLLQRMRELAVQSKNATNTTDDRTALNNEFEQLGDEVLRIVTDTRFNGKNILGVDAAAQIFQVGANVGDTVTVTTTRLDNATTVTAVTNGSITSVALASSAMVNIDTALNLVNSERALYGAAQSRFDAIVSVLQITAENTASARSRIIDADFAQETANLSRAQILQQAGTAMIAQANALPQQVLSLLR